MIKQPLSSSQTPRIAFTHMPDSIWTAGTHYLKNLFISLRTLDSDMQPEIVLLVSHNAIGDSYKILSPYINEVLHQPPPPTLPKFWKRQRIRIEKRIGAWKESEPPIVRHMLKHNIDCIFSSVFLGSNFGVPLFSWIPDFQHLRMPEMFSSAEIENRNKMISESTEAASRVILSSKDALNDFKQFAPKATHKARVVSFVGQISEDAYESDPSIVCDQYHLPKRFIYLPNQFWQHKNHLMVAEALAIAREKRPEIIVVCTGNTNDYRSPLYFGELLEKISNLGVRNNMIILGMVPYKHLIQLIRQSIAVLQPSLFEGWSTTVEEAKSIGKRIIISEISVHKEQDPPEAIFFDPSTPEILSDCLIAAFDNYNPGPDIELEALARNQLQKRTKQLGETFIHTIQEVLASI